VNRTGAALGDAAAVFRSGQPDLLAYDPQQWRGGLDVHLMRFTVYVELHGSSGVLIGIGVRSAPRAPLARTVFPSRLFSWLAACGLRFLLQ
jgi:hypothetical protein